MIICFHGGPGLVSKAIRWQTRGRYSHAAWLLPTGEVIESHIRSGVRLASSPFVQNGIEATFDVYAVRCLTGAQCLAISAFLRRQIGAKYDMLGILRFLAGVNRDNFHRWFCSELVAEACEEAGRPLLRTDAWKISPESLAWSTELTRTESAVGVDWWEQTFGRRAFRPIRDFENWGVPA